MMTLFVVFTICYILISFLLILGYAVQLNKLIREHAELHRSYNESINKIALWQREQYEINKMVAQNLFEQSKSPTIPYYGPIGEA